MAYSSSDLDSVEAAILALAVGDRVVSVVVDGIKTEYGQVDLPQLRALRNEIAQSLRSNSGGKTYLTSTSKGL